jgi:hypothetical protein
VHLSGVYVSEDDRANGRGAAADAYLLAPVSAQELAGTRQGAGVAVQGVNAACFAFLGVRDKAFVFLEQQVLPAFSRVLNEVNCR